MSRATEDTFLTNLLIRLLDAAYDYARPGIPSDTLQRNMIRAVEYVRNGQAYGRLYIDPYWAIYVHDGRAGITKAPLIWFRNPNDDPRIGGGTGVGVLARYDQWRPLTKQEFKYWAKINRAAERAGLELPMKVTFDGVKEVAGSFFFDNSVGMVGYLPMARNILADEFTSFLERDLGTLLRQQTIPIKVSF